MSPRLMYILLILALVFPFGLGRGNGQAFAMGSDSSLLFIENVGQADPAARFLVLGGDQAVWLAEDGIWLTYEAGSNAEEISRSHGTAARHSILQSDPLNRANIKISFPGANPKARIEPFIRMTTRFSFFQGSQPKDWHADVPVWGGVRYQDLYPGTDLEVIGAAGKIALRLAIGPGADINQVKMAVEGATDIALMGSNLLLSTAVGEFSFPLIATNGRASRTEPSIVKGQADLFEVVAPFAPAVPMFRGSGGLVSKPFFNSSFLGGSNDDYALGITVDPAGFAYVTGQTNSLDFPTTPGAWKEDGSGHDVFVVKFNSRLTKMVYGTFIGNGAGHDLAIDANGAAYITGITGDCNFPVTDNAFDREIENCTNAQEAFVVKLNPTGTQIDYATFLGGSLADFSGSVAVDASGFAYVHGYTFSDDFPLTSGAFDAQHDGVTDAFVTKLNREGSDAVYSTLLGGSDYEYGGGIAIDLAGNAYVAGMSYSADFPVTAGAADSTLSGAEDAFIVKLDPPGSHLNYATFLGGFYGEIDLRIAVDSSGRAYVGGGTSSPDFPATPGAYDTSPNGVDAFIAKLNPAGSSFEYATLLGGSGWETFGDIQVDRKGYAYITGLTNSPDFPTSSRAFASTYAGGEDGFVARLVPSGAQLAYASFLGSTAYDQLSSVAVEQPGTVFISGYTRGQDFPIAVGAYDPHHNGGFDIIVARLLLQ